MASTSLRPTALLLEARTGRVRSKGRGGVVRASNDFWTQNTAALRIHKEYNSEGYLRGGIGISDHSWVPSQNQEPSASQTLIVHESPGDLIKIRILIEWV